MNDSTKSITIENIRLDQTKAEFPNSVPVIVNVNVVNVILESQPRVPTKIGRSM